MALTQVVPPLWRRVQAQNFRSLDDLADFLLLTKNQRSQLLPSRKFPLNLPRRLAEKAQKSSVDDPIFRQFVPLETRSVARDGFVADPVGDCASRRTSKLLHKYKERALLVSTGACAMHCRYCFRQHYEYSPAQEGFAEELKILQADESISEVLLSGGDPLSLSNRTLRELLLAIDAIPHIRRIRFHSRFPIGIPERIDQELLDLLESLQSQIYFVIHCNHPVELDTDIFAALKKLQRLGIPVLNQAVLLKGVNDNVRTLRELCLLLADQGIRPYYLHQLDRVEGGEDFEVTVAKGRTLIEELRTLLPGYAVPQYVQEIAGEASKTPL